MRAGSRTDAVEALDAVGDVLDERHVIQRQRPPRTVASLAHDGSGHHHPDLGRSVFARDSDLVGRGRLVRTCGRPCDGHGQIRDAERDPDRLATVGRRSGQRQCLGEAPTSVDDGGGVVALAQRDNIPPDHDEQSDRPDDHADASKRRAIELTAEFVALDADEEHKSAAKREEQDGGHDVDHLITSPPEGRD